MPLALYLTLQAAVPGPTGIVPSDFDLATHRPSADQDGCGPSRNGEIVVCAPRRRVGPGDYPMEEMERRYARGPIRAEGRLAGNVVGSAVVEEGPSDRGAPNNRALVRIRVPF